MTTLSLTPLAKKASSFGEFTFKFYCLLVATVCVFTQLVKLQYARPHQDKLIQAQ